MVNNNTVGKMKALVILPTYNERENIGSLLSELLEEFRSIHDFDMSILVVDDKSPDGTAGEVEKFTKKYQNKVFLLKKEEKRGLGSAYIAAFKHAIDELKAEVIFEMDADFSHNPKDIPRFLKEIEGNDFVVGSRYIAGGDAPSMEFKRKLISWGGNFFASVVAGIPVHDCTSGFRAIRTSLLKKIDIDSLDVQGYAFQMNLLYKAVKNGARVKEIPIIFNDRKYGESKLGNRDILEFLISAFKLRFWGVV